MNFDKALELNPEEASIYNARGVVYANKGDYNRAITNFSEAIRLKPDFQDAYENRARAYETTGSKAKAKADRAKASELATQKPKP